MISVGMIGAGIISHRHAETIDMLDGVELRAVADIVQDKALVYEKRYNAKAYTDYKEMIEREKLNAVVISLPHGLHKEAAIYCANHGLHVLLEKPMANTVDECDCMIEAAQRNNIKLMIGHIQRYMLDNIIAKKLMHSGEFGEIVMITDIRNTDYFTEKRPKWFFDKKLAGGGIVMNYGAHSLDKILYLTEHKIVHITSHVSQHLSGYEVEGNAQMLIELEENISAVISYSGYRVPPFNDTTIYMSEGVVRICGGVWVSKGETFKKVESIEKIDNFQEMWKDFIRCIVNNSDPKVDGNYGKEIIKWIEEVYNQSI